MFARGQRLAALALPAGGDDAPFGGSFFEESSVRHREVPAVCGIGVSVEDSWLNLPLSGTCKFPRGKMLFLFLERPAKALELVLPCRWLLCAGAWL